MQESISSKIEEGVNRYKSQLIRSGFEYKVYQEVGIRWCLNNELREDAPVNFRGGFIADEMGLGKTIQMIGLIVGNMMLKTLIILPPVLIVQWSNQIKKLTGHNALIYHGKHKDSLKLEDLENSKIVITSYGMISLPKKGISEKMLLHQVKWNRLIFDEGHHLRNKSSRLKGAILLKSKIRWLVSGTPIQNRKKDFYNLCSAVNMPESFYTKQENLPVIARNFILKRRKVDVGINLPEVLHSKTNVLWKSIREKELSESVHSVLGLVASNNISEIGEIISSQQGGKLRAFLRARQSCILPRTMTNMFEGFVKEGSMSNYEKYKEGLSFSSKLDSVIESILKNKGNGNGKLVFCHFTEEINEIKRRLTESGVSDVGCFDGRLSSSSRQRVLESKSEVLLMQIQTGCEGLNLQENYSEIYFVSPHWNPCVEDQAIARCHRIGQEKEVKVYKFQMVNFSEERNLEGELIEKTIEKYVNDVQLKKRKIADDLYACQ
jgi:SNF2 family DNA or RNA helicase